MSGTADGKEAPSSGGGAVDGEGFLRTREGVERVQEALRNAELDGWLLFEFHGHNPVARSLLGLGFTTRRSFTLLPAAGEPIALIHRIEGSSWREWPWEIRSYAGWREMEEALTALVDDRPRLAMEVSPRSAVPTLDLVPSGILELVEERGVRVSSSGDLVSRFHARWSSRQLVEHRRAAEILREVAREAFERAAEGVRADAPAREGELRAWILESLSSRGVGLDADCIVAVGERASDPHYMPGDSGEVISAGSLLLIDLWGRTGPRDVAADQTWMGFLGSEVPAEVEEVWAAVRDARDAVVEFLEDRHREGREVRGYEADDVARDLIRKRGYGDFFVHRTGHSIDTELHGSGPNLDNLETRDERLLVGGVGFSVEPGIYIPGRLGVRSEIDVHWGEGGPEVTPAEPQREIFRLLD